MKILIPCEFSGIVWKAFTDKGHDVTSCDLLSSELSTKHYQGDVRDILYQEWDMIIAFPPCRYLTTAGNSWLNVDRNGVEKVYTRYQLRVLAIEFFMLFIDHPCPKICVENPAGIISTVYRKPHQYFCHTDHGSRDPKKTGLWLKGLPPLMATKKMMPDLYTRRDGKTKSLLTYNTVYLRLPHNERAMARSRMPVGVAKAMVKGWG